MLCASVKNKTSKERCPTRVLHGLIFCGKHARVKEPKLWSVENNIDKKITNVIKIWKGYTVRRNLKLAGPGVLSRKVCTNQDELITMDSMQEIPVFDYFGFEENGKIYGFDIRTGFDILHRSNNPINPYTRQPLSIEARKRLRELFTYRLRNRLPIYYENNTPKKAIDIIVNRWNQISQIIEENGFFNMDPNTFLILNRTQLYIFLRLILNDLRALNDHHLKKETRKYHYSIWIQNVLHKYSNTHFVDEYSFYVSGTLLRMLYDCKENYSLCFIIMSALYRL